MSIYKEIKNTGIDLFVSYHPKVIQLKKESKILHKELKSKGLSLMQCQELAAKQNGFHNWYNFIHLIKRHYQQDLDNVPFILTTTKNTPQKSDYQTKFNDGRVNNSKWLGKDEEDNPILLGYDINFGHYKWQNDSSMKTHQLILGQSIYKRYDVYLANQTMKNNRSMVFFNGEGDNDTLKSLVNSAIENKRQSDLKIVNFKNSSVFPEYEYKIQDNFSGSSGMLTEIFFSMMNAEDSLKAKVVSLISATMMYLVYKRDSENSGITLAKIREMILLEKIVAASKEKNIPSHISFSLRAYLNDLSEKLKQPIEEILSKHEEVRQPFDDLLKVLIETRMFDNNEKSINLSSFIDKDKAHIYIFQFESNDTRSELLQKLLLNSIKSSIATKLGSTREGSTDQIQAMTKQNRNVLYVFIRSCSTPKGIAVLPAQARSLGLSINFSYSSLSRLEELSSQREVEVIVANTNTKIFSTLEGDYQTVALLEKYKNEVSEQSVLNLKDDSLSVNINFNRRKNDHVWLVKRGYASQVSFDSPYEPSSIVASDNIKVFMKLEDPKETYDLFENMEKSTD